jgi:hypothetical protein
MKNKLILTTVVSIFALSGLANAAGGPVGSGSMGVTAEVVGTLNLQFIKDGSGMTVGGTTTNAGSLDFGSVQMFGASTVSNLTQTANGVQSFTISTPIDIRADVSNSASTTYLLAATLATADAINAWKVGGVDISSGAITTIAATAAYAVATPYAFALTIDRTTLAGTLSNTINFTATAN